MNLSFYFVVWLLSICFFCIIGWEDLSIYLAFFSAIFLGGVVNDFTQKISDNIKKRKEVAFYETVDGNELEVYYSYLRRRLVYALVKMFYFLAVTALLVLFKCFVFSIALTGIFLLISVKAVWNTYKPYRQFVRTEKFELDEWAETWVEDYKEEKEALAAGEESYFVEEYTCGPISSKEAWLKCVNIFFSLVAIAICLFFTYGLISLGSGESAEKVFVFTPWLYIAVIFCTNSLRDTLQKISEPEFDSSKLPNP